MIAHGSHDIACQAELAFNTPLLEVHQLMVWQWFRFPPEYSATTYFPMNLFARVL